MYPYIYIGDFALSTYRLMLAVSSVVCIVFGVRLRKYYGPSGARSILYQVLLVISAFVAGRIVFLVTHPAKAFELGLEARGFTIFGSIFLCIFIDPLIGRMFGLRSQQVLDLAAMRFTLFTGVQRIGCFLTGCCGGWKVCVLGTCFYWPAQMIESIGDFILLSILLEKRHQWKGRVYPMFLILYGTLRFFVEILRDTEKNILFLSYFQWFSIIAILIGVLWNHAAKEKCNG